MVFEITVDTGAWLRAATGAIGTGTVWCVLGGGMVRLEHRGHMHSSNYKPYNKVLAYSEKLIVDYKLGGAYSGPL